jgi:hypothetical protein
MLTNTLHAMVMVALVASLELIDVSLLSYYLAVCRGVGISIDCG